MDAALDNCIRSNCDPDYFIFLLGDPERLALLQKAVQANEQIARLLESGVSPEEIFKLASGNSSQDFVIKLPGADEERRVSSADTIGLIVLEDAYRVGLEFNELMSTVDPAAVAGISMAIGYILMGPLRLAAEIGAESAIQSGLGSDIEMLNQALSLKMSAAAHGLTMSEAYVLSGDENYDALLRFDAAIDGGIDLGLTTWEDLEQSRNTLEFANDVDMSTQGANALVKLMVAIGIGKVIEGGIDNAYSVTARNPSPSAPSSDTRLIPSNQNQTTSPAEPAAIDWAAYGDNPYGMPNLDMPALPAYLRPEDAPGLGVYAWDDFPSSAGNAVDLAKGWQSQFPYLGKDPMRPIALSEGKILAQVVLEADGVPSGSYLTTMSAVQRATLPDGSIDANIFNQGLQIDASEYASFRANIQYFRVNEAIPMGEAAFGRAISNPHLNPSGHPALPQVFLKEEYFRNLTAVDKFGSPRVIGYPMINSTTPEYPFVWISESQ